jgi:hypothetical protein
MSVSKVLTHTGRGMHGVFVTISHHLREIFVAPNFHTASKQTRRERKKKKDSA